MAPVEPVIDRSAIERLQRIGGDTLARQMIELFLEHGPDRVMRAEASCAAGDASGVEQAAHSLRSSAGNIGARRLQHAAEAAERAAEGGGRVAERGERVEENGSVGSMDVLVGAVRAEYAAAAAELNGLLLELKQ